MPPQKRILLPLLVPQPPHAMRSIQIHADSPTLGLSDDDDDDDDEEFEDTLQLSSSDSSPASSPIGIPTLHLESSDDDTASDDISKDLAALSQLRKSVQKNLRLRPIRSHSSLPKVSLEKSPFLPRSASWRDTEPDSAVSSASTSYFTPLTETPLSPQFITPLVCTPRPVDPGTLYNRLTSSRRPLLIDTRPPSTHLAFHVRYSINIAIPSLILKRYRKPGGGFHSLDALRQFVTTDQGKQYWDELLHPEGPWDGDVVVYDDEMDIKDKDNVGVTAWALMPVLAPLLSRGTVDYLQGGISAAGHHPDFETLIVSGTDLDYDQPSPTPPKKTAGLFQLDTQSALRSKALPEIEPSSAGGPSPRSPLPMMPAAIPPPRKSSLSATSQLSNPHPSPDIVDPSPSPPPSQVSFRRPPPPQRRPSGPPLGRINTKSAERLNQAPPKLSVRTVPIKSATLSVPPSVHTSSNSVFFTNSLQPPSSPSHLTLAYSNHSPPGSARWTPSSPSHSPSDVLASYYTPPHTPGTPKPQTFLPPPSPHTARPDFSAPPTTDEAFPVFTISTILPNFLFLGPEPSGPEHVAQMKDLGVRRILNIAAECDDDQGLRLREVFERYIKIPMRDTVEEENIARGVREVCDFLDDARLHSAPTYVHCKAGKSRSVTAVIAYLIHANHWTLSRAYAFVLERRKGISPNIGFVSELMTFEEQELGGKSVGVQQAPVANGASDARPDGGLANGDTHAHAHGYGGGARRGAHVRESLPPAFGDGDGGERGGGGGMAMSAGGIMDRVMGDSGQEMEIRDASGRYRHARRAPVDENTLQPMRRVSKAGLESAGPGVVGV